MMSMRYIYIICVMAILVGCDAQKRQPVETPWGTVVGDTAGATASLTTADIVNNGEMIMLTMSGPDTYFDYHGRGMGTQYLLCEMFAQQMGVSLRVEVCRDTAEMVRRLAAGEGDIIAYMLPKSADRQKRLLFCGAADGGGGQWSVAAGNKDLAASLDGWYRPALLSQVKRQERQQLTTRRITRRVYAPMLDRQGGIISKYDNLFRRHAMTARWDWRLIAAQCYQESCFDPHARSWAGACGLMQIMPSTAQHLGVAPADLYDPETNVAAAARYIAELDRKLSYVRSAEDRRCFVLACYNGGYNHVADAMALARKHGGNPHRWTDVAPYILCLQQPQYYNDPVVSYGYMRGSETVDYVDRIRRRYAQYRGVKWSGASVSPDATGNDIPQDNSYDGMTPRRATKKYRYHI